MGIIGGWFYEPPYPHSSIHSAQSQKDKVAASKEGNDASWQLNTTELPKYRRSLREVVIDAQNGIEFKPYRYDDIADGYKCSRDLQGEKGIL